MLVIGVIVKFVDIIRELGQMFYRCRFFNRGLTSLALLSVSTLLSEMCSLEVCPAVSVLVVQCSKQRIVPT